MKSIQLGRDGESLPLRLVVITELLAVNLVVERLVYFFFGGGGGKRLLCVQSLKR